MKLPPFLVFSLVVVVSFSHGSVPVPYAGKVSIDGQNYHGQLNFTFAIYTASNDLVWDSGSSAIEVPVTNGRYLVLLGGQGMRPLPASLFHANDELYVGVYADLPNDNVGQVKLGELQRITAQPYALVAEMAKLADVANSAKSAETANVADSANAVEAGAITKQMLSQEVLSDLNRTITSNDIADHTITTNQLNEEILKYLKPEITNNPVVTGKVNEGDRLELNSTTEGKFLNYKWFLNGNQMEGETSSSIVFDKWTSDLNETSLYFEVSNDFGTVKSQLVKFQTNRPPQIQSYKENGFNYFRIRAIQAGSTSDIDNISIRDLDSNETVYFNDFETDYLGGLHLRHNPVPNAKTEAQHATPPNISDEVEDFSKTRIVNGKLRLETVGFNQNGNGGYNSYSYVMNKEPLPENFELKIDSIRKQWAGAHHFRIFRGIEIEVNGGQSNIYPSGLVFQSTMGGSTLNSAYIYNPSIKNIRSGPNVNYPTFNYRLVKQGGKLDYYVNGTIHGQTTELYLFDTNLSISENQPVGTNIVKLNAIDPEGDEFSFSLVEDDTDFDNEMFTLNEDGTLFSNAVFDFETRNSFSIKVMVKDLYGAKSDKVFKIDILDLEESSTITSEDKESNETILFRDNLVLHYSFDEQTELGQASDESGNKRDGTLFGYEGGIANLESGKLGKALKLDGSNDHVVVPAKLGLDYSVSMWIKTTDQGGDGNVTDWDGQIALLTGSVDTHGLFLAENKFQVWSNRGYNPPYPAARIKSTSNVNLGIWTHVVGLRSDPSHNNNGDFKIFINGVYESGKRYDATKFSTGGTLFMGKTQDGELHFEGLLDDLRIYDKALTADEVYYLFDLGQ